MGGQILPAQGAGGEIQAAVTGLHRPGDDAGDGVEGILIHPIIPGIAVLIAVKMHAAHGFTSFA